VLAPSQLCRGGAHLNGPFDASLEKAHPRNGPSVSPLPSGHAHGLLASSRRSGDGIFPRVHRRRGRRTLRRDTASSACQINSLRPKPITKTCARPATRRASPSPERRDASCRSVARRLRPCRPTPPIRPFSTSISGSTGDSRWCASRLTVCPRSDAGTRCDRANSLTGRTNRPIHRGSRERAEDRVAQTRTPALPAGPGRGRSSLRSRG
jgi:hypothetical protein